MTRRIFSVEFKREAAQLVTVRGVSVAQASKDLDVHATVLRRWVREFGSSDRDAIPGDAISDLTTQSYTTSDEKSLS